MKPRQEARLLTLVRACCSLRFVSVLRVEIDAKQALFVPFVTSSMLCRNTQNLVKQCINLQR
jgi:hypothetical protein